MFVRTAFVVILLFTNILSTSGFLFKRRKRPLAIDGGWSLFGKWTSCHLNTENNTDFFGKFRGFSLSSQQRVCNSPRPVHGGKPCLGSSFRYRQCGCQSALGMQSGRIKNVQITSNTRSMKGFEAEHGRIGGSKAWCAADPISPFSSISYQVDMLDFTEITAIATEGIPEGRISRFKVLHSLDGKKWTLYRNKRGNALIIGNLFEKIKRIEFSEPFVARYITVLPVHSFNRVCLRLEIYGCIFTCGKQMSASGGEIVARSSEMHNQKCLWKIDVQNTTDLNLDFITFDIPCESGFLEIRDGSKPYKRSNVMKKQCGSDLPLELYKAPINSLWLYFHSNSSSEEVGFRIRYISQCFKKLELKNTDTLQITTPNYPKEYFDNTHCTWIIQAHSKNTFLVFKAFDVDASKGSGKEQCVNDFVLIEGFKDGKFKTTNRFCNTNSPKNLIIPIETDKIRLQFKSDNEIVGKGFLLQITSYNPILGKPTEKTLLIHTTDLPLATKEGDWKQEKKKLVLHPVTSGKIVSKNVSRQLTGVKQNQNSISNATSEHYPKKKKIEGTDWTIFTIAAFSCVVFVLIVFVTVISLRKCTSRYRDQPHKFLPAISKTKDTAASDTSDVLRLSKKSFEAVKREEQLAGVYSPAGSIAIMHSSEHGSELGESEPLKADIVTHRMKKEARNSIIDMYTDGEMVCCAENSSLGGESISSEPIETVI